MTRQFLTSAIIGTLALTACGGGSDSESASTDETVAAALTEAPEVAAVTTDAAPATTEAVPATTEAAPATTEAAAPTTEAAPATTEAPAATKLNLNTDGPGACIDAVIAHLGPDAMINEVSAHYEVGEDIEAPIIEGEEPAVPGDLSICKSFYQDPDNPIKLLGITMDTDTGEFGDPEQVEITVSGDPADFDLNDYIMKASDVDTSIIQPRMDEEAPALDEKFSLWRWQRVDLVAPGPFNDVHVFDLRMAGRLASNDIEDSGYLTIDMAGNVVGDHLD